MARKSKRPAATAPKSVSSKSGKGSGMGKAANMGGRGGAVSVGKRGGTGSNVNTGKGKVPKSGK